MLYISNAIYKNMPLQMILQQVEQKEEDSRSREWQIIGAPITRETGDISLCDFIPDKYYFLKMTAVSQAGSTSVLYRVQIGNIPEGAFGVLISVYIHICK